MGDDHLTGGEGSDEFQLEYSLGDTNIITDFDPSEDNLIVDIADSGLSGEVTVVDWTDGTGADLFISDQLIASVTGGQGLTPEDIDIR